MVVVSEVPGSACQDGGAVGAPAGDALTAVDACLPCGASLVMLGVVPSGLACAASLVTFAVMLGATSALPLTCAMTVETHPEGHLGAALLPET